MRSGVVISVHSFASDPSRGVFLLLMISILVAASLVIFCYKTPKNRLIGLGNFTRELFLVLNAILLSVALLTILLGTLYPMIIAALNLGAISVGAPYFNLVMLPILIAILLTMGLAAFAHWQHQTLVQLIRDSYKTFAASFIAAAALLLLTTQQLPLLTLILLALCIWVCCVSIYKFSFGANLIHSSFAILIIGILLSSMFSEIKEVRLKPNDQLFVGPYEFILANTKSIRGENYRGLQVVWMFIKIRVTSRHYFLKKKFIPCAT